jgi:hypothetical protein
VEAEAPKQPEVPAETPAPVEPAKVSKPEPASGTKEPVVAVVVVCLVFIALAAVAFYAFTQSK